MPKAAAETRDSKKSLTSAGIERPTPKPGPSEQIRIQCACGQALRVGLSARGKKIKCPKCSKLVVVPVGNAGAPGGTRANENPPVLDRPSKTATRRVEKKLGSEAAPSNKSSGVRSSVEASEFDDDSDELAKLKTEVEAASQLPIPDDADAAVPKKVSSGKLRKLRQALEVTNILSTSEAKARREAILELGETGDPRVIEDIRQHADDPNVPVREAVAIAAGTLGQPESVPLALHALLDPEPSVVCAAIMALKKNSDRRVVRPLLWLGLERPEFKPLANDSLVRLGSRIVQDLLTVMLSSGDPGLTLETIVILGRIGDKQAVPALIQCSDHVSTLLRAHVTEALALIGDSRAVPQMLRALTDPMTAIRVNAAAGLVRMPDPKNLHPLLKAMQDEDADVRRYAAVAIGELADPQAVPYLLPVLEAWEPLIEADPDLLEAVVETLGKLDDARIVPGLIPLLRAKHDGVLLRAVIALKRLRDPSANAALIDLVRSPKATLRRRVIETLGQSGDPTIVKVLSERLLEDSSPDVRAAAARALGELKSAEAVPTLEEALRDETNVRIQVVIALGSIRHKSSQAALMAMLKDGASEVRYHALNALGKFQDPRSMKALASMLQDADPMVKSAAEKALEAFGEAAKEDRVVKSIVKKARSKDLIQALIPSWIYLLIPTSPQARAIVAGIAACALMMPLLIRVAVGGPDKVLVRGNVQGLAISADGNTIVAERTFGLLEVWDVEAQEVAKNFAGEGLRQPMVRPNGDVVVLQNESLIPWPASGDPDPDQAWKEHKQPITKSAVSNNGKFAFTLSRDLTGVVWDLESGRKKGELEFTTRYAEALSVNHDGLLVAAANARGEATVVEVETGKQIKELVTKLDGAGVPIVATTFSPDGKWLAAADRGGSLKLWDLTLGDEGKVARVRELKSPSKVVGWRFFNDSQRILSIDFGGKISAWHLEKEEPQPLFAAEIEQVDGFALDDAEKHLALGSSTGSAILVFDLESGDQIKKLDQKR